MSCPGSGPAETEAERTAGCDACISASISSGPGYSGEPAASQTGFAHPVVVELARSVTVANGGMTARDYTQGPGEWCGFISTGSGTGHGCYLPAAFGRPEKVMLTLSVAMGSPFDGSSWSTTFRL